MEKQTSHDEQNETGGTESRRLNMEEKRKLERLLIADIDSASCRQDAVIRDEREALIGRLVRNPSAEVAKLLERHKLATKQQAEAAEKLEQIGYSVGYNGILGLRSYSPLPKHLDEFDKRAVEKRLSLSALRRSYIIKLFADHADTQGLFASLAKDLERLIR
jgi:hypothetical protein